MRRTFTLALITLISSTVCLTGQTKSTAKTITLANRVDSLSYALGQNMTNGLKPYLLTAGVLKDTTASVLIENYNNKLANADESAKTALRKELAQKRAEVEKANSESFAAFLKGLESAFTSVDPTSNGYNNGIGIGNQLSSVGDNFEKEVLAGDKLNRTLFLAAILASLNDEESLVPDAENYIQQMAMEAQQEVEIKRAEELKALHGERISEGVRFLADNKTKEGVVTLPSGLQYKVVTEGTGVKPGAADNVKVHYEGRLLDGTVFDSSYQRGEPITLGVGQVIRGWTEALQIMPVGSKWELYIPYDLAYGSNDQGQIKPFSTLVFDVELLEVMD